jgi:hypothetical protein
MQKPTAGSPRQQTTKQHTHFHGNAPFNRALRLILNICREKKIWLYAPPFTAAIFISAEGHTHT